MRIYTKAGDRGETALIGGQKLSKAHPRIATYGGVDELNSQLGVCRALDAALDPPRFSAMLATIQDDLFVVGSDLAARESDALDESRINFLRIQPARVEWLEAQIDPLEELVGPFKYFVIPGGTLLAAQLHVARCVCRRVEREVVALSEVEPISPTIVIYLNRLSDLLFIMARAVNHYSAVPDIPWRGKAGWS